MARKHLYLATEKTTAKVDDPAAEGANTKVWREVLRRYYRGDYQPGQRLKEAELTQQLGVSRSSVREGLARLAAEGVVILSRHKSAVIRNSSRKELLEILDVIEALLKLGVRLATANVTTTENRQRIETELRALLSVDRNASMFEVSMAQTRFFRALLEIAGSGELRRALRGVHVHFLRLEVIRLRSQPAVFADYMSILAAVLTGDAKRAQEAVEFHIDACRQVFRDE